ncbi:MAG: hypothetical protein K6F86_04365 [Lachnospiraceae bacterium]|nr:hypothetical protein [Lachnospiraceae bacterium]
MKVLIETGAVRASLFKDIVAQLEDIYKKNDLDDERVLAYCQPVFNIRIRRG